MKSSEGLRERAHHNLTLHPPEDQEVADRMDRIRAAAHVFLDVIIDNAPGGRELSMACTSLEDATMYAIAAVARNQDEKG